MFSSIRPGFHSLILQIMDHVVSIAFSGLVLFTSVWDFQSCPEDPLMSDQAHTRSCTSLARHCYLQNTATKRSQPTATLLVLASTRIVLKTFARRFRFLTVVRGKVSLAGCSSGFGRTKLCSST